MRINSTSLRTLHFIMDTLAKGKDPTSDLCFPEDTILNSKVLQQAFKESAKIFKSMLTLSDQDEIVIIGNPRNRKLPFFLLDRELDSIIISDEELTISRFAFQINETIKRAGMKKLKATQLTAWLTKHEYLEQIKDEYGMEYKIATKLGETIGIRSIYKENSVGKRYVTNLYSSEAQRFLVKEVLPQLFIISGYQSGD